MKHFIDKYKIIARWVILGAGIFSAIMSAMATVLYTSSCVVTWFGLFSRCASLIDFITFLGVGFFVVWIILVICFFVVIPVATLAWWLDDEGY